MTITNGTIRSDSHPGRTRRMRMRDGSARMAPHAQVNRCFSPMVIS